MIFPLVSTLVKATLFPAMKLVFSDVKIWSIAVKILSVLNVKSFVAFNLYLALNASLIVKPPSFLKEILSAVAINLPPTLGFAKFKVPSGELKLALFLTSRLIVPPIFVFEATTPPFGATYTESIHFPSFILYPIVSKSF